MYTLRESFTIDRRMDAEDFIVSLESSIESYPLQSRNEFVEEQLVYKGGERKKRNKKGWREREEEKIKKIKKKKDEHSLPSVWYTYTTCVRRTCSCNALTTMKARRNDNRLNAKRSEKGRNI